MPLDISKRRLLRPFAQAKAPSQAQLPWLKQQASFEQDCSRCGECLSACPEQIIVQGDGGYPVVDFAKAECSFCYECAKACPEKLFAEKEQQPWRHQSVAIKTNTCLSVQGVYCRSCKENCDESAISIQPVIGGSAEIHVDDALCSSCGACISVCPTQAIEVTLL